MFFLFYGMLYATLLYNIPDIEGNNLVFEIIAL